MERIKMLEKTAIIYNIRISRKIIENIWLAHKFRSRIRKLIGNNWGEFGKTWNERNPL